MFRAAGPEGGTVIRKMARDSLGAAHIRHEYARLRALDGVPGVVQALALEDGQVPVLTLEDAGPEDLAARLRRGPLELPTFFRLAVPLAEAVEAIHARGLLHRDINPTNVVLRDDAITLIDLGLATKAGDARAELAGTLRYIAPEQTGRTERAVDARADLYALGATYFEMLTGAPPFVLDDPAELVHAHLALTPIEAREANPGVPVGLSDLVARLLAKAPEDRYQSASALLDDLRQAEARYRARGTVERFELGRLELETLPGPARLHGRDRELAQLRAALERARGGAREVVVLRGPGGIGKSALVRALGGEPSTTLVVAKFEALRSGWPYAALVEAFHDTAADPAQSAVFPTLEALLEAASATAREAESRSCRMFQRFVQSRASPERPLILALDDLQWADSASFKMLELLATAPGVHHMVLVCALRPLAPDHPAERMLASIERALGALPTIDLGPLPLEAVVDLCADVLSAPRDRVRSLATEVFAKTRGNPLFVERFLRALHRARLLRFDPERRAWTWELPQIADAEMADDVVDLMIDAIARLDEEARRIVQVAACLPEHSALGLLAKVAGVDAETAQEGMERAAREGLVTPTGPSDGAQATYAFTHDRIRQAAYAMLDEEERARVHLTAGRALLEGASEPEIEARLFDVVGQLNLARIEDDEERRRLAALELRAGRKARRAAAFGSALDLLRKGIALLAGDPEADHELVFALHREAAEAAFFANDPATGDALLEAGLREAEGPLEAAELHDLRLVACTLRGATDDALAAARAGLEPLGIDLPRTDLEAAVSAELAQVNQRLLGRSADELLALPPMRDPRALAAVKLLTHTHVLGWNLEPELASFAALRLVSLSLEHGNASESAHAYVLYGTVLRETVGDYAGARSFEQLGIELNRRLPDRRIECRVLAGVGILGLHWSEPLRAAIPMVRRAITAGLEAGEFEFAAYAIASLAGSILGASGMELTRLHAECNAAEALLAEISPSAAVPSVVVAQRQTVRSLQGATSERARLEDDEVGDAELEVGSEFDQCALALRRMFVAYLFGEHERAARELERARPRVETIRGFFLSAEHNTYGSLVMIAQHERATPDERVVLRAEIERNQRWLRGWATRCPQNFLHKQRMVAAELTRIDGRPLEDALALYDEAIDAAHRGRFVHDEAIASELAARACLARGRRRIARAYLLDASDAYLRWGASAKVSALEEELPSLLRGQPRTRAAASDESAALDLLSLLKAAESLSSEVIVERLLETLMGVCLEAAGATYGALVLLEDGAPMVRASSPAGGTVTLERTPLARADRAPPRLLGDVLSTTDPIVLGDAAHHPRFATDPYVAERAVKSALALPIRYQAKSFGALYLENQLATRAFSEARVRPLTLLSSQIAISLANSLLFERQLRAERTARFLADVGVALAESLDYRTTLAKVARLSVPFVADLCAVDLVEPDGSITPAAEAHVDPTKEALLRDLHRRYPAGSPGVPGTVVLRTGQPLVRPGPSSESEPRADVIPPEMFEEVRALGVRSTMSVPLIARGEILGVLTFCSTTPGRTFCPTDLTLAQEVAHRATLSIENARLYHEARTAVRRREEFMTVVAHELRTPTTALDLSVGLLGRGQPSAETLARTLPVIARQNARLKGLIETLFDQAALNAGELPFEPESVDLDAVVREVAEALEPDRARADAPLRIESEGALVGRWDRARLAQVVRNLLENAIKFGAGESVLVRIERAADEARLIVQDRGLGIDPERLPHVFERFVRGVSPEHYGGLGLGLYIAREIVIALGGRIDVESEVDEGSTFTVTLPLAGPPR